LRFSRFNTSVIVGQTRVKSEPDVQAGFEAHLAANLEKNEPADEIRTSNPSTLPENGKAAAAGVSKTRSTAY
jgi:hypothetical protein